MIFIQSPSGVPFTSLTQNMGGADWRLSFEWNMRAGWFLGMADQSRVTLFAPKALRVGVDLLAAARHDPRCPPGSLVLLDLSGADEDPGYLDLATGTSLLSLSARCVLVYLDPADLA